MLNIDRVKGIVRAKYGSQIPKFEKPASPLPKPNPNSLGSMVGTPKMGPITNNPAGAQRQQDIQKFTDYINKHSKEVSPERREEWIRNKARMASKGFDYDGTKTKPPVGANPEPEGTEEGGLLQGALGGLFNTDSLFGMASQLVDSVDINSKGMDAAMGLIDTISPAIGFGFRAINSFGSKTMPTFQIDNQMEGAMGSGYGGSFNFMKKKGEDMSGKEVGFFTSSSGIKKGINQSKQLHGRIMGVYDDSQSRFAMANSPVNANRQQFQNNGGFNFKLAARLGGKLDDKINLVKSRKFNQVINVDTKQVIEWEPVITEPIEEFKNGGVIEWEPVIEEIWEPIITDPVEEFKDGGTIKEELETPEIEETSQKNLIPEGALHKNKHHMENTEGLTQKGIPVIDNEGEQQAEIELDEIIFTLEVTKKLEELYKEGTDEAAIEAGKLLVKEILFNTDDRTGLIAKCEKGGKL